MSAVASAACEPNAATDPHAVDAPTIASVAPEGGERAGSQAAALSGKAMPHVAVHGADGQTQDVDALRAGKPALVTFWATWCDSCRKEFDALNRLDERIRTKDAMVIGVAVGESSAVAGSFAKSHDLRYAMLFDEEFKLSDALGQRQVPATLVLDREGHIVYSGGALDEQALDALRRVMAPPAR